MKDACRIVPAQPQHLAALPEIERLAAMLFRDWGVSAAVLDDSTSIEDFEAARRAETLWVALQGELPIGFAFVEIDEDVAHLDEIDVDPAHGRRGVGTALVDAVCAWARAQGYGAVTLTTYRDIPWNAPFYARLGFRVVDAADWTACLRERVEEEAQRGLDPQRRVVMRLELESD